MSKRRGGNAPEHNDPEWGATEHRLTLLNRSATDGYRHRHPWQATCVCGWRAVPTRRRDDAEQRYREHRDRMNEIAKQAAKTSFDVLPRPPTPPALLPEALR